MKVAFFQPYLAAWRIEFLERFIKETDLDVVVYDGGFKTKKNSKSVSGNQTNLIARKLWNLPITLSVSSQQYPIYFSPLLAWHLLKDRPQVILTEGEINILNNFTILIYCKLTGAKYFWWSLGKVRTRKQTVLNKIFGGFVEFVLNRSDLIIARNTMAKQYYLSNQHIPSDKIVVAPNSMDEVKAKKETDPLLIKELKIKKTGPVILYSGALTFEKRPSDLIVSLSYLIKGYPGYTDAELWFIGAGPESDNLKQLAVDLDCASRVKFYGRVTSGVGSYFSVADIVVVPGLGGLAINHAMIFGCPVVSRVADGTEFDLISNGETGYILDDYDNHTLAKYIDKTIKGNANGEMSRNAKLLIENEWNMSIMIKRIEEAFENAFK